MGRHGIVHPKDCKRTKHPSSSPSLALDNGLSFPSMLSLSSSETHSPGCSSTPESNADGSMRQYSGAEADAQANKHRINCSFKSSFSDLTSQKSQTSLVSSEISHESSSLEHEPV